METKFNFYSQICTTREQSERLLALGLKKETADMFWTEVWKYNEETSEPYPTGEYKECIKYSYKWIDLRDNIPAWSLARLVELMPQSIVCEGNDLYLTIYAGDVVYTNWKEHTPLARTLDLYEHLIWYIEWLIKEGYFNKEYLEDRV